MEMKFEKTAEDMTAMAAYVAQLTKDGVTFKIEYDQYAAYVTLTGGY